MIEKRRKMEARLRAEREQQRGDWLEAQGHDIVMRYYDDIAQYDIVMRYYDDIAQYDIVMRYYDDIAQYDSVMRYYTGATDNCAGCSGLCCQTIKSLLGAAPIKQDPKALHDTQQSRDQGKGSRRESISSERGGIQPRLAESGS